MALLLQGYLQVSDAEAVRLSATDRCWRVVLGTLVPDDDAPAFSQGGLQPGLRALGHLHRALQQAPVQVMVDSAPSRTWRPSTAASTSSGGLRPEVPLTCSAL